MPATTVTRYVVQALLSTGNWTDASAPQAALEDARRIVRQTEVANVAASIRIVERRVTTVEEVLP